MRILYHVILLSGLVWSNFLAAEEPKILYLAHQNKNSSADIATAAAATTFKRLLEAQSGGKIRVEIFPEGQLGSDFEALKLVKKGVIQSSISSVGGISRIYPKVGILDFPFVWEKLSETYRVFDGPFNDYFAASFKQETGLEFIGFIDTGGFFQLSNDKHPVQTPADMSDLTIRTMNIASHQAFIESLGAEPVAVRWSELSSALGAGVVDGQMNPSAIIRLGRLDEEQQYLTVTNHLYTPYLWVINETFLNGLSEQQKEAVEKAATAGIVAARALAANTVDHLNILRRTMKITHLNTSHLAEFRAVSQPAMRLFIQKNLGVSGIEALEKFLQAIENARSVRGK